MTAGWIGAVVSMGIRPVYAVVVVTIANCTTVFLEGFIKQELMAVLSNCCLSLKKAPFSSQVRQ